MKTVVALIAAGLALAGCSGSTGGQGVAGPTGSTGAQGPMGLQGPQGDLGPQGPMGVQGPAGSQGPQGVAGPAGAQGIQGPQGTPGPKGLVWKGAWSGIVTYSVDDAVQYQGTAWIAVSPSTAVAPPSVEWALLASRGDQGATGSQGPAGPTGDQGPQGAAGLPGPSGPAGLNWRGSWSGAVTYGVSDAVESGGASYIAVAQSTAIAPPSIEWSLLAASGSPGSPGPQGPPGPAGVLSALPPLLFDGGTLSISSVPADATHGGHVTAGPQVFGGVKYGPGFIAKDVLGCADVRAFGAVGDGVSDDTAAIQAAINSFGTAGGPVCFPRGDFRITDTIYLGQTTSIRGAGRAWNLPGVYGTTLSFNISGTGNNAKSALVMAPFGVNGSGMRLDGFVLRQTGDSPGNLSSTGIECNGTGQFTIQDVYVQGFGIGARFSNCSNWSWLGSHVDNAAYIGMYITGGSGSVLIAGDTAAANASGANGGDSEWNSNIRIDAGSRKITIRDTILDEAWGSTPSSIEIFDASDVHLDTVRVYAPGGGIGIKLCRGDGDLCPSNVTITNTVVTGFTLPYMPTNTIKAFSGAAGLVMTNVTTVPSLGGDISDASTAPTYLNVNGSYRLPSLPSTNPGPGSKQLWYDPADGNRVKFAP